MATLKIASRFCGPPDSANGGYLGGRLAALMPEAEAVEVSFMTPCPLDTELDVVSDGDTLLLQGEAGPVARAKPATLDLAVPTPPGPEAAAAVAGTSRAFQTHPFPLCFVCGPECREGLTLAPGPVGDHAVALWTPAAELEGKRGCVAPEFLWAALDCPSSFPLLEDAEVAARLEPMVLGRITLAQKSELPLGQPARIVAWALGQQGRKGTSATALFTDTGSLVALAQCVWISIAGR